MPSRCAGALCGLILIFLLGPLLVSCGSTSPSPASDLSPVHTELPSPVPVPPTATVPPSPTPSPVPPATPSPVPTVGPPTPLGLQRMWVWTAQDILCDFAARDFEQAGTPSVAVASYDRRVYRVDAWGGEMWSFDTGASVFSLAVADLDGDGLDELLTGSEDGTSRAFSAAGEIIWQVPLGGRVTALAAVDLDGDGRPEVLAGARPAAWQGDVTSGSKVVALAGDGTVLWQRDTAGAPTAFLTLGGVHNRVVVLSTEEGALQAFDAAGVFLWQRPRRGYIRTLVPFEDGLLVGDGGGGLRWLDSAEAPVREKTLDGPVPVVASADLDGDGSPEVLAGVGGDESALVALDRSGDLRWRTPTGRGVWSLAFPDLEGDGQPEVVAGTDGGEIIVLDAWGRVLGNTWVPFRVHGLLAVDLDGDGSDELLARASNHLYAFASSLDGEEGLAQPLVETLARWPEDAPLIPPAEDQVVLVAVGDIMPGRAVEQRALVYGTTFPFEPLVPLLRQADITTGNLEGVMAYAGIPLVKSYTFRGYPGLASGLVEAGFDLLSLANNHARDFGGAGLYETIDVLHQSGIETVGAGPDAYAPVILERKGLRIAFLGRNAAIAPQEEVAWGEEEELRQAVATAHAQADLVIVHLHAGVEYSTSTDETQRRLAQAAADGGAALVIGHHSHSPQEVTRIGDTLVAYSLGDFVFDIDDHDIARDGVVLRVLLSSGGVDAAEWIPVRIVDDVQPRARVSAEGRPQIEPVYVRPESALPAPPSPRPAYALTASIFPHTCTVQVGERIVYPNTTGETLGEVVLQVFPNYQEGIFHLERVEGMGPSGPFSPVPILDGLMLHVPLAPPLAPGEEVEIDLSFTLNLPSPSPSFPQSNLSCSADEVVLGFWYPLLVPYRPDTGWLIWANHPVGDPLVMEIADHTLHVTVPDGYQVISGGELVELGRYSWYRLEAGRELALVVGRGYEQAAQEVDGVRLTSFFQPGHRPAGRAALEAVAAALPLFRESYGPYPYGQFSLVEAEMSCGLEHSGLGIIGTPFYATYGGDPLDLAVRVAVHEFSHQWWYGVVGTDQVYEPWLDEGLAQYSEALFYERYYPQDLPRWWEAYGRPSQGPPSLRSTIYDFSSTRALLDGLYGQSDTFFQALRDQLGDQAFFTLLRAYYHQGAYRLARGDDLLLLAQGAQREGVDALVEQFFFD